MAIENRNGTCRTCNGRAYRQPSRANNIPDRWVHRNTADWINNPHEVDPMPDVDGKEQDTDS